MSKRLLTIIIIVIVALAGVGTWWFLTSQSPEESTTSESQTSTTSETQEPAPVANNSAGIMILFTNDGFDKQNYSVAKGKTVTVENDSTLVLQFSSDEHPTHTNNPELNMEAIQPGQQRTFTPERTGEWGIHDHEHPEFTTKLTVTD